MDEPNTQELYYNDKVDYLHGSPHLAHSALRDELARTLTGALGALSASSLPMTVLEVGAGHGGFTEPALAVGASVTAIEMSRPSLEVLLQKYGGNSNFRALHSTNEVEGQYSLALAVAVLHHIPDYLTFVTDIIKYVAPGGSFLCLQDPSWYPRRRTTHKIDRLLYLFWRVGQGNLRTGARTFGRRVRGTYDDAEAGDMVEYHVVRDGVDDQEICELLRNYFGDVKIISYWSNQSTLGQRIGVRLGLKNTFGILASKRVR